MQNILGSIPKMQSELRLRSEIKKSKFEVGAGHEEDFVLPTFEELENEPGTGASPATRGKPSC